MKKLFVIFVLLACWCVRPSCAVNVIHDETIRGAWGAPGGTWDIFPRGKNAAEFCLGDTTDGGTHCNFEAPGSHSDERAVLGLIARKITATGGYFCTTQIQCGNKRKQKSTWTWHLKPKGTGEKCFWLCKPGYTGDGCGAANESELVLNAGSEACVDGEIYKDMFKSIKRDTSSGDSNSIEGQISAFHSTYERTSLHVWDEKDVVLGIAGWLPNKRGAIASPVVTACGHWNWSSLDTQIIVNSLTNLGAFNVCLPGYGGADCGKCKPKTMCSGYAISDYDASQHMWALGDDNCAMVRCSDPAKGFNPGTKNCVDCGGAPKNGVHPTTGVCVKCETGKKFNSTTGNCDDTIAYSQSVLSFGPNKTAQSELMEQCWVQIVPDDYKKCVAGTPAASAPGR
ncbi:MAG: hypothetical protein LBF28_02285 [Rickettsiales bacterium]|jgi:hypothetical protein|nr:hypothetical protein [Rickettsiales bacterium]